MERKPHQSLRNALSVDVEDYFQVAAFRHHIPPQEWDHFPRRVVGNVYRILDWLDGHRLRATFFILGWVARRHPGVVREIQGRGHEIASHGFGHQLIHEIGPVRFRDDVRSAKCILEDISGTSVVGYRAPSYSINWTTRWALDILLEEGFRYDSSLYPILHDLYGVPGGERFPFFLPRPAGCLREFPISTWNVRLAGRDCRVPVGGGGYLRLLPAPLIHRAFLHLNLQERQPGILYFHPWEIDPDQPRIPAGWRSRLRHYLNLDRTFGKLDYLVRRLPFTTVSEVLSQVLPAGSERKTGDLSALDAHSSQPSPAAPAGEIFRSWRGNGKAADH